MNFFTYTTAGRLASSGAALALTALLAGCGKEEPKVYSVTGESAGAKPAAAAMPPHGPGGPAAASPHGTIAGATPRVTYQVPPGWKEQEPAKMRAASFVVEGAEGKFAEISVVPLPAVGGKEADMVNIWRNQLHLTPVTDDDLAKVVEAVEISDGKGRMFDMVSTETLVEDKHKGRIVAAMLTKDGLTWFFKMAGEDTLTTAQKPAFKNFLKSIGFAPSITPEDAASMPPGSCPIVAGKNATGSTQTASTAMPALPDAGATPTKPSWTVPAGWTEMPPSQMLVAKFAATGENTRAEITVSSFPGDVGGLPANVNRWRNQIGLARLPDDEALKSVMQLDPTPGKLVLVELAGTDPKTGKPAKLVGVIVPKEGQTWFYKLMGDESVVAREKDALVKFAQGAKY